jgi:hypothetical protein
MPLKAERSSKSLCRLLLDGSLLPDGGAARGLLLGLGLSAPRTLATAGQKFEQAHLGRR